MVDGLAVGIGYAEMKKQTQYTTAVGASSDNQDEGTAYITYAIGGLKVGAQRGVVNTEGTGETNYDNEYLGVSYAVSDSLSIS